MAADGGAGGAGTVSSITGTGLMYGAGGGGGGGYGLDTSSSGVGGIGGNNQKGSYSGVTGAGNGGNSVSSLNGTAGVNGRGGGGGGGGGNLTAGGNGGKGGDGIVILKSKNRASSYTTAAETQLPSQEWLYVFSVDGTITFPNTDEGGSTGGDGADGIVVLSVPNKALSYSGGNVTETQVSGKWVYTFTYNGVVRTITF